SYAAWRASCLAGSNPAGARGRSGLCFEACGAEGFHDEAAIALDAEGLAGLEDLVARVGAGDPELTREAGNAGSPLDGDTQDGAGGELVQASSGLAGAGGGA